MEKNIILYGKVIGWSVKFDNSECPNSVEINEYWITECNHQDNKTKECNFEVCPIKIKE